MQQPGQKESTALPKEAGDVLLGLQTVSEKNKTVRTVVICGTILIALGMICWTLVRIYTHDFWLEVLAILATPITVIGGALAGFVRYLLKRVQELLSSQGGGGPPNAQG